MEQQSISSSQIKVLPISTDIHVRFVEEQLQQILQNLVANAMRHGGENITVTISSGTHPRSDLPWLKVQDDGKGIRPEAKAHLFEPFFTTARNGTGLGLFLCRELCEANQAQLELEEIDKKESGAKDSTGASFVITFAHSDRIFQ
jgi:two-component system sensor histidine kinase PilS (NtrC family)